MELTRKDIDHLADLAHLALSDEEKARYERQLASVLDYVGKLAELERADAALTGSDAVNVTREDRVVACSPTVRDGILADFPDREGDLLAVPAVFATSPDAS